MKKLLSLCLALVLALSLAPAVWAAETVTPTPPSWVPEEEYAVFEGSAAYEPKNWAIIEAARKEVSWGAINLGALTNRKSFERLPFHSGGINLGVLFEMALVETRLLYTHDGKTGPYWTTLSLYLKEPNSELLDGVTEQQRYALLLWSARDALRGYGVSESIYPWLSALSAYPSFSLETLWNSPIFTKEEQAEYAQLLPAGWAVYSNRVELYLDGQALEMDVPPEVHNQRTMVPIRVVAEALGADVEWKADTQEIVLTRAGSTVTMILNQTTATVDGQAVEMDVAPYATEGRTLIPARYVAEFFGQLVTWDGETRRVNIAEDKSGGKDSNLERWAIAMGAIRWEMDRNPIDFEASGVPFFGQFDRNAQSVRMVRKSLAAGWGISDRTGLIDTVTRMTPHGHNDTFLHDAALAASLTEEDMASLLAVSGKVDAYMWPYTKQLGEKWGTKGILAWDLSRMSNLVQWGYTAGYLTYEEALELSEPAARLAQETFSSWHEFYLNYLDGYNWWARNDVAALRAEHEAQKASGNIIIPENFEDWMLLPRAVYYMRLLQNSAFTFDDTLFETGVIGLPK